MMVQRLDNGNLLVPVRAEDDKAIGDAWEEIDSNDTRYAEWVSWLQDFESGAFEE